jgi:hypothetical protein
LQRASAASYAKRLDLEVEIASGRDVDSLSARIDVLGDGEGLLLGNQALVRAHEQEGFWVHWPDGQQFRALEAEGATTDALAYPPPDASPAPGPEEVFAAALEAGSDAWLPASSGTEQPFRSRAGQRLLYVYNPALDQHGYLDLDSDVLLSPEQEAQLQSL